MTDKDGGPAFPLPDKYDGRAPSGMSLRDWFAGQALQGMIIDTPDTDLAAHAYALADAMLAEREKRTTQQAEDSTS